MFLSRSSLIKTILTASLFFTIAVVLFVVAYLVKKGDLDPSPSLTMGIVMTCLAVISVFIGVYSDGVSKPFVDGARLVRKDLQPKKYIDMYKEKSGDEGYVIARPSFDMLELLYTAYDLTEDKRGRDAVIVEMKAKMKPAYKGKVAVYAADKEYRAGNIEEGDRLLSYAEKHDDSSTVAAMADAVRKTSRAEATGDTASEEIYYKGMLSANGIFKADNAAALLAHWRLYNICKNSGRENEAKKHLTFCADHGGSTTIRREAKALL